MRHSVLLLGETIHQINRSLGPRMTAVAMMVGAALSGPSAAQMASAQPLSQDPAADAPQLAQDVEWLPMPGAGMPSPALASTARSVLDRAARNTLTIRGRTFDVSIGRQVVPGETGRRTSAAPVVLDTFGEPQDEVTVQASLTSDSARAYLGRGRPSAAPSPTDEVLQGLNHRLGRAAGARMVAQDRMHFLLEVEEALSHEPASAQLKDLFELASRSFADALDLARLEFAGLRDQVVAQRRAGLGVEAHVDAVNELSARVDPDHVLRIGGQSLTVYGVTMRMKADAADAVVGLNQARFRDPAAGVDLQRFTGRVTGLDLSSMAAEQQAKWTASESAPQAHR